MTAHAPYLRILRDPATIDLPARMSPDSTAAKSDRALHIPATVLALPGLSLLARCVLAEVIDLYKCKGSVFAKDDYFAERLGSKPRTVREAIADLEAAGYVTRVVNYSARHKRLLTPAELWQNLPLVVAKSATTPEVPAESAISSGEIRRDLWQNPPEVVADSANINTSLNTKGNTNLKNTTPTAAHAAAAGPEKKIGVVEASRSLPTEPTAPTTAPPVAAAPPNPKPKPGTTEPEHFPGFWEAWPKKEGRLDAARAFAKLSADDQAAAASRADTWLAARPDLADPARYRFIPHASTWLNQQRWTDEAPAPSTAFTSAPHANHGTSAHQPGRPQPGEKPSAAGTLLAGSLAQRRWQQRNGGAGNS